jgi:hypothetical protein
MSIAKTTRSVTQLFLLATYMSSTIANAEPDQQNGKRRGPPREAIEVCADQSEGAACSFSGRRGEVAGSCIAPPQSQDELACAPEGGPPKDHGGDEV